MAALTFVGLGDVVPGSRVGGGGTPGGCGVEVLEDVAVREFEGSIKGFEGRVGHCFTLIDSRVFIAESGVCR